MDRRRFLQAASVAGVVGLSGCQGEQDVSDQGTHTDEGSESDSDAEHGSKSEDESESDPEDEDEADEAIESVYHVATDGSDSNSGSPENPLASIQEALERAHPGDTVEVQSGEYFESYAQGKELRTIRSGDPGHPITISGPTDAIVRPGMHIRHSHIHLRGLTIEALVDPDNRDDPESYFDHCVLIEPPSDSDAYLRNIVCAPDKIGYSAYSLIRAIRTKGLEIGPLQVAGIAGARWILPEESDRHAGEIIYLGSPPTMVFDWHGPDIGYPWEGEIDETQDVHIHHIDNSGGHPHSQLVDAKLGTKDITIEYCTDGGGSRNTEPYPASSIALRSHSATVRWCELRGGEGDGILVNSGGRYLLEEASEPEVSPGTIGRGYNIYGNRVTEFGNADLMFQTGHPNPDERQFDPILPADLEVFCKNKISSVYTRLINNSSPQQIETNSTNDCPSDLPEGDGIGHLGGDSPWS